MLRKIGRAPVFSSILSGVLLAAAFNNSSLWIFSWFAFVPIFLALENKSRKQTALLFFIAGIAFWSCAIYWLVNVTLAGTILLILYLAVYFGIFGLIIRHPTKSSSFSTVLFIPSAWVLLEYARSHLLTGFPWAILGYSQYLNLAVIQIADITGVWGVSFLIMLVNVATVEIIWLKREDLITRLKITVIFVVIIFSLILSYGYYHLSSINITDSSRRNFRISVVQPNIPQELKWNLRARAFVMQKYFELTNEAVKEEPALVIWPEAALPVVLEDEPEYYLSLQDYVRIIQKPLLFGAVTSRKGLYYNSAILLSEKGVLSKKYNKLHLVPFGEFIPFRSFLKFLDTIAPIGDITRGNDYTIFDSPAGFGVLICFEDVFPELARSFVSRGAKFLVNITNDAWFGKTPEAYQHLAASVFRAVENRVYLARAANTGVSAFISSSGEIISLVSNREGEAVFIRGHKTGNIDISSMRRTFYNRYGDFFPILCLLFIIGACGGKVKR